MQVRRKKGPFGLPEVAESLFLGSSMLPFLRVAFTRCLAKQRRYMVNRAAEAPCAEPRLFALLVENKAA